MRSFPSAINQSIRIARSGRQYRTAAGGRGRFRGLWKIKEGSPGRAGHFERIEQCGNRFVVTSGGVIHDVTTDRKLAGASNDVRPARLGPFDLCIRTTASTGWVRKAT